jgi:hypothetical protein
MMPNSRPCWPKCTSTPEGGLPPEGGLGLVLGNKITERLEQHLLLRLHR